MSPLLTPAASALQVRILLALFMDGVLFGSVTLMSKPHPGYWCIYLTHWTLLAVCAHLTLSVAGTVAARRSLARSSDIPPRPWWLPVVWSAQAIALPGSLLVFVLFWCEHAASMQRSFASTVDAEPPLVRCLCCRALVYPGYRPASSVPINYFVHGANFGAMVVDAVLSNAPYFFFYIWSSWLAFAIIYVLFTIVYFFAGGTDENGNVRDPLTAFAPAGISSHRPLPPPAVHLCGHTVGLTRRRCVCRGADRHHRVRRGAAPRLPRVLARVSAPHAPGGARRRGEARG